jgi:hypothetical protein
MKAPRQTSTKSTKDTKPRASGITKKKRTSSAHQLISKSIRVQSGAYKSFDSLADAAKFAYEKYVTGYEVISENQRMDLEQNELYFETKNNVCEVTCIRLTLNQDHTHELSDQGKKQKNLIHCPEEVNCLYIRTDGKTYDISSTADSFTGNESQWYGNDDFKSDAKFNMSKTRTKCSTKGEWLFNDAGAHGKRSLILYHFVNTQI